MGNVVKLVFSTVADGGGLTKVLNGCKELNQRLPGLSRGVQILGAAFGSAGTAAGNMISMLLSGGAWGAVMLGVTKVAEALGVFRDRAAEAQKQVDEMKAATERFHEAVLNGSEKALARIDAETKKRNAQLDVIRRMTKAELELQRARAVAAGDERGVAAADARLGRVDADFARGVAESNVASASRRVGAAEGGVEAARRARSEAVRAVQSAEAAYRRVNTQKIVYGGVFSMTSGGRVTAAETAVRAAREQLKAAEKTLAESHKTLNAERERWNEARTSLRLVEEEQKAANARADADRRADVKKELADRLAMQKKVADDLADEERQKRQREKQRELEDYVAAINEEAKKREEARKKQLKADIDANRKAAGDLADRLGKARERLAAARDVTGNAAAMDQAGELRAERQKEFDDARYAERAFALQKRINAAGGDVTKLGRLSNIDRAVLERMRAGKEVDKNLSELKKLNGNFEALKKLLEASMEI